MWQCPQTDKPVDGRKQAEILYYNIEGSHISGKISGVPGALGLPTTPAYLRQQRELETQSAVANHADLALNSSSAATALTDNPRNAAGASGKNLFPP
jgi:hypothetical protein